MQTAPNPQDVDPNEIGIVPENEELVGYVYKRVVREVLARIDQRLAEIEKQAAPEASEASVFRTASTASGDTSLLRRWGTRVAIGALLSVAVIGGAAAWYFSDADGPRTLVARWIPLFGSSSSAPQDGQSAPKDGQDMPMDLSARGVQTTTDGAAPQPASLPTSPPDNDMRPAAAGSGELAPMVQKLTSEIETLGQGIDRLRMSQDQLSRDNALAMQQLQAGQEQLVRLIKPTAQNAQAQTKPAAGGPRRAATRPPRNPAPAPSLLFRRAT
jgi:pyruvate/2-oxoglutarate dehydrogenase complex dihydrolipoamide acyltransferase (E2) component